MYGPLLTLRSILGILLANTLATGLLVASPDTPAADERGAAAVGAGVPGSAPEPGESLSGGELSDDELSDDELFAEGLTDELLLFEDIPVIVSASRQPTPRNQSSAAVSTLRADEIHATGATRVEDLLQLLPGMDVLYRDRSRSSVGIRGSHDYFADRTLVLIDGRAVNDVLFGGVDFPRLPLFLEDIERIEVVRGPGGAAWGSSAHHGVINIITKSPETTLGTMNTFTVNEFGDVLEHARWGAQRGAWSWRISVGYEDRESSSDALTGEDFVSDDSAQEGQLSFRLHRHSTEGGTLELGGGYSYLRRGHLEFVGSPDPIDPGAEHQRLATTRAFARWNRTLEDGSDLHLLYTIRHQFDDQLENYNAWWVENSLEAQWDRELWDGHHTSIGGQFRLVNFDTDNSDPSRIGIDGGPSNEQWYSGFLIDRWRASEQSIFELQARIDHYSETQTELSGRLSWFRFIGSPLDERVVRLSLARSFRAPSAILRDASLDRFPLPSPPAPADTFGVQLIPSGDLENESVNSVELGYTHPLSRRTFVKTNAYWLRYERVIGIEILPDPLSLGRQLFTVRNLNGAQGYGLEIEANHRGEHAEWSAWYAYNGFSTDTANQSIRARAPARHKAGLRTSLDLIETVRLFASYRYTSRTEAPDGLLSDVPEHHLVDLTATWSVRSGVEISAGVQDLFDEREGIETQLPTTFTTHPVPGRTFFIRTQFEF